MIRTNWPTGSPSCFSTQSGVPSSVAIQFDMSTNTTHGAGSLERLPVSMRKSFKAGRTACLRQVPIARLDRPRHALSHTLILMHLESNKKAEPTLMDLNGKIALVTGGGR